MESKGLFIGIVKLDGQLDASCISYKETIYTSKSGKHVERFIHHGISYIYKPCTAAAARIERWAQQYLIPSIEGVKVPYLLASGGTEDPKLDWIIYEDLGPLIHCNNPDDIIRAAEIIPSWHRLPTDWVPRSMIGHSPSYTEVLKAISREQANVNGILAANGISPSDISSWWTQLPNWEQFIQDHQRVSHGDYYPLNIAFRAQESIVLDWEFVHVNSVYWDLYSLMDITSHRYPRIPLSHVEREAALLQYWTSMGSVTPTEPDNDFIRGYYAFASVYSVWILTLIELDLRQTVFIDSLRRQQEETLMVFQQCMRGLNIMLTK
ncbi:MAG: phosphotransferase [Paenibacillaceae bacterium]